MTKSVNNIVSDSIQKYFNSHEMELEIQCETLVRMHHKLHIKIFIKAMYYKLYFRWGIYKSILITRVYRNWNMYFCISLNCGTVERSYQTKLHWKSENLRWEECSLIFDTTEYDMRTVHWFDSSSLFFHSSLGSHLLVISRT